MSPNNLEPIDNILQAIGWTPMVKLNRVTRGIRTPVYAKAENLNPGGSVKDRIGVEIIEAAERKGDLKAGGTVVEATSGNTGVGLALACAIKGYRCIFTIPDKMSTEKVRLLRALGAEVIVVPTAVPADHPEYYINKARAIVAATPGAIMADQHYNPANPEAHYRTTGPEIWEGTAGAVDIFVAGVGTGGTITGAGRYLREKKPSIRIVAVEPAESPVLSGGEPSPHKQQGIGAGFIPGNLDTKIYQEVVKVTNDDAIAMARRLAREEAIFAGISSGSITWAAVQIAARPENKGKLIVSVICDFGERYLSNPVYADLPDPDYSDIETALV
jgi:cysteine synthase A